MKNKRKFSMIQRMIAKGIMHANNEGGGGGGGGQTAEQLAAALAETQAAVEALKNKNTELLTKNKEISDIAKQWEGLDPAQVRTMLDRIQNDEELKLLAEGKHDEVIKKRTEKVEAKYKTDLEKLQTENQSSKTELEKAKSTIRNLVIDSKVVSAFVAEGGVETAIQDVILRAQQTFTVEDGEAIIRDKDGKIVTGKDGAMTVKEWAAKLKEEAPHLFHGSSGAGLSGGRGGSGLTGIQAQMAAASKAGDVAEYRRLKAIFNEQQKKKA